MKKKLLQNTDDGDYDPFAYPPHIVQAEKHAKAALVGKYQNNHQTINQICPCCDNHIEKTPMPMCCSAQDLLFLGIGYSLFLSLFKYCFALIFLVFLVSGSFVQIIQIFSCGQEDKCITIFNLPIQKQGSSYAKYSPSFFHYFQITLLTLIITLIYYLVLRQIKALKQKTTTICEFTIMLLDLPKGITKNELCDQAEEIFDSNVQMMTFCYGTNDINEALHQKQKLIIMLNTEKIRKKTQRQGEKTQESEQILNNRIKQIKLLIEKQDNLINSYVQTINSRQCNMVFITFQSTKPIHSIYLQTKQSNFIKKIIYYLFPNFETSVKIKEKNVSVRVAPHPRQIIWQNIGDISKTYKLRSILFIFLMLLAIFAAYYIQFYIVDYLYRLKSQKDLLIVSACILVIILIIANNVLRYMLQYLLKLKSFCSYSHYQATFCFYYSIVYVFNTCFLVYTIHQQSRQNEGKLFLIEVFLIMVINAFSQSVYTILDPKVWIKIIMRKYVLSLPQEQNPYPQGYMNKLMEGAQISNTDNYHFFIRLAFVSVWFCNLSPTGLLIALLGLITYYGVSKYFLLRMYRQPQYISQELTILVLKFFIALPLFYCLGLLKYNHEVKTSQNLLSFFSNFFHFKIVYFTLALAVINYIIFSIFRYKFLLEPKIHTNLSYSSYEVNFSSTYQTQSPLSKLGGQYLFIPNFLQQNNYASPRRLGSSQQLKDMKRRASAQSPQGKTRLKDNLRRFQTENHKQLKARMARKSTFQLDDMFQALKQKKQKMKLHKDSSLQMSNQQN